MPTCRELLQGNFRGLLTEFMRDLLVLEAASTFFVKIFILLFKIQNVLIKMNSKKSQSFFSKEGCQVTVVTVLAMIRREMM